MRTNWIVWTVVTLHLFMGILLIIFPTMKPLAYLVGMHYILAIFPYPLASALLITVSLMIIPTLLWEKSIKRWRWLLVPQYLLVILSLTSIIFTIASGHLSDGKPIVRQALVVAGLPLLSIAFWHTIAIVHYLRGRA